MYLKYDNFKNIYRKRSFLNLNHSLYYIFNLILEIELENNRGIHQCILHAFEPFYSINLQPSIS